MDNPTLQDKIALLRLAFKGLEETELLEMAKLTHYRTYPANTILCQEGEYEDSFYIVDEGSVVVSKKISNQARQHVLRVGGRGDLVGEMGLIQNAPRAATVRTLTECVMLEMGKQDFETILRRSPHMAMDIIRITLDRLRANDHMAIAELERTNNLLRQLDRNKLDFIQVAAHELRTPLTVLNGYLEILHSFPEAKANPSLEDVIQRIMNGSSRIQEVVNMMLDVTRIDAEILNIGAAPVPVHFMIGDVVHSFGEAARERNIELSIQRQADLPDIYCDTTLVKKALYHLVVNAIKYTPDGGKVAVSTRTCLIDDDIPGVEIIVQDTGIGLDPEHQSLIFEKFYQVGEVSLHSSGKTTFKGGGPGLGLAIVRGVARAHGGKVWVESQGYDETVLRGSAFHFQLPIRPPVPQAQT